MDNEVTVGVDFQAEIRTEVDALPKITASAPMGGKGVMFRIAWLDPLHDMAKFDPFDDHNLRLHNISLSDFDVGETVLLIHNLDEDSRLYAVQQVEDWPDEISDRRQVVTLERYYLLSELNG